MGFVNSLQLSCGCWVTVQEGYGTGSPFPCRACDTTRTVVIGWSRGPVYGAAG